MKIRTVLAGSTTLAVVGLAAATLAPVSSQAVIVKAGKTTTGCSVTVDGPATTGTLTGPVIKTVQVASDPTNPAYAATLGYYPKKTYYAGSAALATTMTFSSPGAACGSVSVVMYGVHNSAVDATPLETRTTSLIGATSPMTVNSLVADVSSGDSNEYGPCLGLQLEVRDTNGNIVQLAPTTGPELQCPGQGGGFSFGG